MNKRNKLLVYKHNYCNVILATAAYFNSPTASRVLTSDFHSISVVNHGQDSASKSRNTAQSIVFESKDVSQKVQNSEHFLFLFIYLLQWSNRSSLLKRWTEMGKHKQLFFFLRMFLWFNRRCGKYKISYPGKATLTAFPRHRETMNNQ